MLRAKKFGLAVFFVVALMLPTVLGVVPLTVRTPVGVVSLEAVEAEARSRNTRNNTLRNLRVQTSGVRFTREFIPHRNSYTINMRASQSRVRLQPQRGNNQQSVRHRIDSGRWSSWRTGNNAHNRITVNVRQGQERRLRIAVRDQSGNVRTYNITVRRAGTNTFANRLRSNVGRFDRSFSRNRTHYVLTVPMGHEGRINIRLRAAQATADVRVRQVPDTWSRFQRREISTYNVHVGLGQTRRVHFQVRAAFNNLVPGTDRVRTYTVDVRRAPFSYQEIYNHYARRIRNLPSNARPDVVWGILFEASEMMYRFMRDQSGVNAQWETYLYWLDKLIETTLRYFPALVAAQSSELSKDESGWQI